jgi:hypothetical protein
MQKEFEVGNLVLSTPIKIRIPDYGYDLPEINSSSPISIPIYASVANIINWLERGISIEFCNKDVDGNRVLLFVTEYNKFASENNKNIKDVDKQHRLALNAEDRLRRMMDFSYFQKKKKTEEAIPFKKRIFKKPKNSSAVISSSYQDASVNKYFRPSRNGNINNTREVRAYDIFAPDGETLISPPSIYDNIQLN